MRFGSFTGWTVVKVLLNWAFVEVSNYWSGLTTVTNISEVDRNSSLLSLGDSFSSWKFIRNLVLASVKNLSNLLGDLWNSLLDLLVNFSLNFLLNMFSPLAFTFSSAFLIPHLFHPFLFLWISFKFLPHFFHPFLFLWVTFTFIPGLFSISLAFSSEEFFAEFMEHFTETLEMFSESSKWTAVSSSWSWSTWIRAIWVRAFRVRAIW